MGKILYKRLSDETIGACIEVHKLMGPNFSEKVYEACVARELEKRGYHCQRQILVDLYFKGAKLDERFRIDMLVANRLILEFKAVPDLDNSHIKQILSYLEATIYEVGYLVNFARPTLQFQRFILENERKNYKPEAVG